MRLETLGAMAALAAALLTVEQRGNASTFGLVLSYALSITMLTSMTVSSGACYRLLSRLLQQACYIAAFMSRVFLLGLSRSKVFLLLSAVQILCRKEQCCLPGLSTFKTVRRH